MTRSTRRQISRDEDVGLLTDVTRWFVDDLHRDPRGGKASWLMVGLGITVVAVGLVGLVVEGVAVGTQYVLLGGAFGAMGAAELVPADRIGLARNLRVGSLIAFGLYATWVFGPPFLAASRRVRGVALAAALFLVGFGWLLYEIFDD